MMEGEIENLNMQHVMAQLVLRALNVTRSEKEAAARLGISVRSMNRWKHKYNIKYYEPGFRYYIPLPCAVPGCEGDLMTVNVDDKSFCRKHIEFVPVKTDMVVDLPTDLEATRVYFEKKVKLIKQRSKQIQKELKKQS